MRPAVVITLLGVAACDWSLHRMQEPVRCDLHGATTALPGGSCDLEPPDGIVAAEPVPPTPVLTRQLIERGRDRFERICAACHGVAGDGNSAVARAMTMRRPPPLVDRAAATLSDDRILTVMTTGYGMMPSYRAVVAPTDRIAILHYIRVLQQREVSLDELPAAQRGEAERWLR